jgi:hypothetical protein
MICVAGPVDVPSHPNSPTTVHMHQFFSQSRRSTCSAKETLELRQKRFREREESRARRRGGHALAMSWTASLFLSVHEHLRCIRALEDEEAAAVERKALASDHRQMEQVLKLRDLVDGTRSPGRSIGFHLFFKENSRCPTYTLRREQYRVPYNARSARADKQSKRSSGAGCKRHPGRSRKEKKN